MTTRATFYHITADQLVALSKRLGVSVADVLGVASPIDFWTVATTNEHYGIALFEENEHTVLIPAFQVGGSLPGKSPAELVKEGWADIHRGGKAYQFFRLRETDHNGHTIIALQRYWSYDEVYAFIRQHILKQTMSL